MKIIIFCLGLLLLISSCYHKNIDNDIVAKTVLTSDIVAEVNGEPINSYELEQSVSQQVFDELNRIYQIKSIALDYLIDQKIIEQEAIKKNLSTSEYLKNYYESKITVSNIDSLVYSFGLKNVPVVKGGSMVYLDKKSQDGRTEIKTRLESILKTQLLDSLKKESLEICKYIYPPKSPKLNLSDLPVRYRGNSNSKISMIVVSDYECDRCIQSHGMYNEIYDKYKNRIKYGSINFSSIPTFASMAAEAAYKQNKFWNFSDSLFVQNGVIDSAKVYNIAKNMNLDMIKFDRDLHSEETFELLTNSIDKLVDKGLFATPTIIINGRLIFQSNSINEITHLLNNELGK